MLAVAACSFLFVSCNTNQGTVRVDTQTAGKIAFVNMDSVQARYDYHQVLVAELATKKKDAELKFQQRAQAYAKKENSFMTQYKGGLLSNNEATKRQQVLQEEAAQLQQYGKSVEDGLLSLTNEKNEAYLGKILSFLEEYNKEKGYSYIMRHGYGSPLLVTSPSYDITTEVIDGLNAGYAKEMKGEVKEEGAEK